MKRAVPWLIATLVACRPSLVTAEPAQVEQHDGLSVVFLEGSPAELGRQHGEALEVEVRRATAALLGYFRTYLKIPLIRSVAANWWLDRSWARAKPFIPADYLDELRALASASGVSLRDLWRVHAIPDRTYACSGLAVWGRATADGRLIHTRNLDWTIEVGIQRHAAVLVVHPAGKHAFVNVGWAGFIGALTGINDRQISIGQIGAETADMTYAGLPMTFLMRRVLEEADDLEEAVRLIREAPRTVGVNYVVSDANAKRAVVIETTRSHVAVFEADDVTEHRVAYARPLTDAVFRADTAVDAAIRDRQLASGGNPRAPGLEPPTGSAYEVRYLGQSAGILAHYGRIDVETAKEIANAVAPNSNVQSVIFAWPELWVANARGLTPAAHTTYHQLDLPTLFDTIENPKSKIKNSVTPQ
jgi:hypothetical protein